MIQIDQELGKVAPFLSGHGVFPLTELNIGNKTEDIKLELEVLKLYKNVLYASFCIQ